jgi:hypothetical protein
MVRAARRACLGHTPLGLLWVIFARSARSLRSRHVRFAPIALDPRAPQRTTWCASCGLMHRSKQNRSFDDLAGNDGQRLRGQAPWELPIIQRNLTQSGRTPQQTQSGPRSSSAGGRRRPLSIARGSHPAGRPALWRAVQTDPRCQPRSDSRCGHCGSPTIRAFRTPVGMPGGKPCSLVVGGCV